MNYKLTIITCSYNYPELLKNLINSINKQYINYRPNIIVCENSDNENSFKENIKYLESQNCQWVRGDWCGGSMGRSHASGVRKLIPMIKTKWAILLDTDIELLKPVNDLIKLCEKRNAIIAGLRGIREKNHIDRIHPWFMLFNAEIVQKENFYFNSDYKEEIEKINPLFEENKGKIYDVGCRFLEEIQYKKYKVMSINNWAKGWNESPWFKHWEGLSWCEKKSDTDGNGLFKIRKEILKNIKNK